MDLQSGPQVEKGFGRYAFLGNRSKILPERTAVLMYLCQIGCVKYVKSANF